MKAPVLYLISMLLFGFSTFALAEAKGVFLLSGGEAEVEKDAFSGSDTSLKIGSGFRVNENSGIEIYWATYGAPEDVVTFPGLGSLDVEVKVHSLAFQYVHFVPVAGSVDLLARLGFAFWKSEFDIHNTGTFNDDGIGVVAGLGAEVDLIKDWALRLEFEYSVLDNFEVGFASVGVAHYFD